ncbi:MAG: hypothetical protein IT530_21625 [Burkholderiales bacterium]|nr:hypothetical protein [Burkholderiales bacterium]
MKAISSTQALAARKKLVNPNSGAPRWRTPFLGIPVRTDEEVRDSPLAFLVEMTPESVLPPHFHPVDQYQVFVSGSGLLGRHRANPLAVHYADRHTAYGPITAGRHGVAYFTLRGRNDGRGMFLHKPGAREQLQPSKRRFRMVGDIALAVPPVLAELAEPTSEALFEQHEDDGLACYMLRLGAGASMRGPDPAGCGGQFYLVLSGSLHHGATDLPPWSVGFAAASEPAPILNAGAAGAEVMVLQFPQPT